jgi:hypothetical protein
MRSFWHKSGEVMQSGRALASRSAAWQVQHQQIDWISELPAAGHGGIVRDSIERRVSRQLARGDGGVWSAHPLFRDLQVLS